MERVNYTYMPNFNDPIYNDANIIIESLTSNNISELYRNNIRYFRPIQTSTNWVPVGLFMLNNMRGSFLIKVEDVDGLLIYINGVWYDMIKRDETDILNIINQKQLEFGFRILKNN